MPNIVISNLIYKLLQASDDTAARTVLNVDESRSGGLTRANEGQADTSVDASAPVASLSLINAKVKSSRRVGDDGFLVSVIRKGTDLFVVVQTYTI